MIELLRGGGGNKKSLRRRLDLRGVHIRHQRDIKNQLLAYPWNVTLRAKYLHLIKHTTQGDTLLEQRRN